MPSQARSMKEVGVPVRRGGKYKSVSQGVRHRMEELTSSFVPPAIIFEKPMPTPSMTASRMAHVMAPLRIALKPPRTASAPPVIKPAPIAFHGSSFFLSPLMAQSESEKRPPHVYPPR